MWLALAHAELGQPAKASDIARRMVQDFPSFTVEGYIHDWPVALPAAQAALRDGARKAGLSEAAAKS
jgi:hypothetical protein